LAVGGDPAGGNNHSAPLDFQHALTVKGLHNNNGILYFIKNLDWCEGMNLCRYGCEKEQSDDHLQN